MTTIETMIDIAASPDRVWRTLTDFGAYAAWNPFMRKASGEARQGGRLELEMQLPGRSPMTFRPVVLDAEPGRTLRWRGRLVLPGLFDGEHYFRIEPMDEGRASRLTHGENFSGVLMPLIFRASMRDATRAAFEAMNRALKERAEAAGGRPERQ